MSTLIDCPSCRRKLRVPEEFLGKSVRCPSCAETFRAPESAAAAPPPAETAPAPEPASPSPQVTVPLKLELDDEPSAPRPSASAPPKEAPPERRRDRERDYDDDDDDDRDSRRRGRSRRRRRDFEPCPRCGDDIRRGAVVCPYCGLDLEEQGDGYTRRGRVRLDAEPHRAGTVQALGIASLVLGAFYFFPLGLPLGIAAWVMGRKDLKKMEDGVMDPDGRKKTKDGWLCGLVGTCLNIFWGLGLVGFIMVVMAEAASSNGPGPRPPAPVRPVGKQGWAPPPAPAQPRIDEFSLNWPGGKPVVVNRGDDGKMVFVDVDRAPAFVGKVTITVQQPLPPGVRVDRTEIEVDGRETRAHFTISAEEDAVLGEKVLRLTGRSASGRQVILDLRVKVEP